MVRDFTRGIGDEARQQCLDQFGALPDAIAACVGGGSNAIGLFTAFLDDAEVAIFGFEAGGDGVETGRHAATISAGESGVLHGARTFVLQDEDGQTIESHSISAGPRLPRRRPAARPPRPRPAGRRTSRSPTPRRWTRWRCSAAPRGSSPRSSRPTPSRARFDVAEKLAAEKGPEATMLVNLSGRGDKDMGTAIEWFGLGDPERHRGADRMTASERAFDTAAAEGRAALVGYLPAGFPDVAGGIEALRAMVDAGCDVIEVGLPYSDPVMDGPTIQAAAQQALDGGVRTRDVLRTVEAVAATGTPTVVMTYWNPVERYGVERFAADLASAGGAGLITPDLTPDSGAEWIAAADAHDLDKIFLVAPSSTDDADRDDHRRLPRLRLRHRGHGRDRRPRQRPATWPGRSSPAPAPPPTSRSAVGLGVSNGDQAAEVASYADGVIVGSAFVRVLLDHADDRAAGLRALAALTEDLAGGVRRA